MDGAFPRAYPHLEDRKALAGGDTTQLRPPGKRRLPAPFNAGSPLGNPPASPPGENKRFIKASSRGSWKGTTIDAGAIDGGATNSAMQLGAVEDDEIEKRAQAAAAGDELAAQEQAAPAIDFLKLVGEAEAQSSRYMNQMNLRAWAQTMRAFHQQHWAGSKYTTNEYRNRSSFFRPKTRSAVWKDMAAVAASLFNNIDAINCLPGNEGDPKQRAAAAVMEELINYRTDRASGRAAIPWFNVAMGARQDSLLCGICISKQSWKLDLKRAKEQNDPNSEIWEPIVDRPDCQLIPPENVIIDPAADWTDPIQTAQYVIIKWPMTLEEVRTKQASPINPWNPVPESVLRASTDTGTFNMAAIRRARELDLDRLNDAQTGEQFQIVWVYEVFMRVNHEDYTFVTVADQAYLTDPRPVEEVYPEQFGERPLTFGYGSLEAHRIFPMAQAQSWQMMQAELNDLINLSLDAIKQNVMPVSKVVRGRNIDLDQVKRRSYGSSIIVSNKDDVTWERPPDIPQSVPVMARELELEFDDLAGQFNGQTAENSNALSRTLGGLKLVAGSANAVQEFNIRIWIETWCAPALAQIVRLEQYYEADETVLGLCGERAKLFEKHGINAIDDELLEKEITVRVSVGLGAGDPQQRLQKFAMATQIALPLLQQSKKFQSGEWSMNEEAIMQEIYGAAGYRDGGARFITKGQPQPNQMQNLEMEKLKADIEKAKQQGKSSMLTGLAAVAKVALGNRELEAQQTDSLIDATLRSHDLGHQHAKNLHDTWLNAMDHGHRHGLALAQHKLAGQQQAHDQAMGERAQSHDEMMGERSADHAEQKLAMDAQSLANAAAGGEQAAPGGGGKAPAAASAPAAPPPEAQPAPPEPAPAPAQPPTQAMAPSMPPPMPAAKPRPVRFDFQRGGDGKIIAAIPVYADETPQQLTQAKQAGGGPQGQPPPEFGPGPRMGPNGQVPLPPRQPARNVKVTRGGPPGREIPLPPEFFHGAA